MSKVFSTHPPTDDRIREAQKNIQQLLKAKPEYVVTTSEFNMVKARLQALTAYRKVDEKDAGRPTLRRKPGTTAPTGGEGSGEKGSGSGEDDDRPTLKRRP